MQRDMSCFLSGRLKVDQLLAVKQDDTDVSLRSPERNCIWPRTSLIMSGNFLHFTTSPLAPVLIPLSSISTPKHVLPLSYLISDSAMWDQLICATWMRKLRGLKGEIIFPMAAKTKVRRWGTSPLSVDGKIGAFCVCLPLSYLINLPRRHLIPDIMAHLSPVFTSGMLSAVRDAGRLPANTPPLPPRVWVLLGQATVSWGGQLQGGGGVHG